MKRYIDMIVRYTEDGHIIPLAVRWSAGELFDIYVGLKGRNGISGWRMTAGL